MFKEKQFNINKFFLIKLQIIKLKKIIKYLIVICNKYVLLLFNPKPFVPKIPHYYLISLVGAWTLYKCVCVAIR